MSKSKEELKKNYEQHLEDVRYCIKNAQNEVVKESMIFLEDWLLNDFKKKHNL